MKESAKGEKSHHWLSHKPKTPPPPSVDLLENYKELADELQHIENNLKETTERQQWTMKEIEANKTKNTKALRLLVEATEDLLHTSDPEDYAQSPHKEDIGMSPSFNARNLVSKTDDVIPSPKRDRVLAWKPSIFRRSRMTHRGSTPSRNDSSSNLISRSRMLKNSSFRKLFKPTDKDKNSVTEPAQPSPAKNGPNETAHPVSRLESTSRRQGRGKPIYSSATSSSDENEVRTEVSREALYEILVRLGFFFVTLVSLNAADMMISLKKKKYFIYIY